MSIETAGTTKVTAERIAQQFGFNTQHGTYAWRVILNSPLDSERCRTLISEVGQPGAMIQPRMPGSPSDAPFKLEDDKTSLILRGAPHPAIEEFFTQHGWAVVAAGISQLSEVRHLAWASQAQPLLMLIKECSFSLSFAQFVRTSSQGPKMYNAFARGILRLIRDGDWVDTLGDELVVDEVTKYTNFRIAGDLDVVGALLVALPTLLNTISALSDVPPPRGHAKAMEQAGGQLRRNMDKLAKVAPELLWLPDGAATEIGVKVAYIYNALLRVLETLRM